MTALELAEQRVVELRSKLDDLNERERAWVWKYKTPPFGGWHPSVPIRQLPELWRQFDRFIQERSQLAARFNEALKKYAALKCAN